MNIIPYQLIDYLHFKGVGFLLIMTLGLSHHIDTMKKELENLNINLENRVQERTWSLHQKTLALEKANINLTKMDQIKTRFFANMSHEFRTPLTLILSPIESFLNQDYGRISKAHQYIFESMQRNGKRLIDLITNILDYSKIEAGKMKLHPSLCNIHDMLRFCIASIEPTARAEGIQISMVSCNDDLLVPVDKKLIEKAFFNLLSNAIKFNRPHGFIQISSDATDERLTLCFKNSGMGFDPDQKEKIFERFWQAEQNESKGTGIGLSLTKEIIELHKGCIKVESSQGEWAKFIISLPVYKDLGKIKGEDQKPPTRWNTHLPEHSAVSPSDPCETILIVEDNKDMQQFLISILEKNYSLVCADDGENALSMIENLPIDLIVTDLMMPKMDGFELIKRIRQNGNINLPILILSAKSDLHDRLKGFETGGSDYLTKPFSPGELLARIRSHLKLKHFKDSFSDSGKPVFTHKKVTKNTIERIEKIIQFIKENFMDQITRENLAFVVDMSPDHLGRSFKQHTGQKIADYLNKLRTDQAKKELRETDKKIIDIAFEVGFESLRTFNKVFRKLEDTTPSDYRNKAKNLAWSGRLSNSS